GARCSVIVANTTESEHTSPGPRPSPADTQVSAALCRATRPRLSSARNTRQCVRSGHIPAGVINGILCAVSIDDDVPCHLPCVSCHKKVGLHVHPRWLPVGWSPRRII